jgi:hypothetical protein
MPERLADRDSEGRHGSNLTRSILFPQDSFIRSVGCCAFVVEVRTSQRIISQKIRDAKRRMTQNTGTRLCLFGYILRSTPRSASEKSLPAM